MDVEDEDGYVEGQAAAGNDEELGELDADYDNREAEA